MLTPLSFLSQRHTFSRLRITESLFRELLLKFEIFPQFRDFVLLFGARSNDRETSLPQLRFRRLASSNLQSQSQQFQAFGTRQGLTLPPIANVNRVCLRHQIC